MEKQTRIANALDRLFRTYPSFAQGSSAGEVLRDRVEKAKVYFEAVEAYEVRDIEAAVSNFLAGSAPGHNPSFAPPAPLVGAEVRRVMNLRLDSEARSKPLPLPAPQVHLDAAARQRMSDLARRAAEALRMPDRAAEQAAEERRKAGWAGTNARFQPDMSPEATRKRLGFSVGDPDGSEDAA